jgi:hypothetical protein
MHIRGILHAISNRVYICKYEYVHIYIYIYMCVCVYVDTHACTQHTRSCRLSRQHSMRSTYIHIDTHAYTQHTRSRGLSRQHSMRSTALLSGHIHAMGNLDSSPVSR